MITESAGGRSLPLRERKKQRTAARWQPRAGDAEPGSSARIAAAVPATGASRAL